MLSLLKPGALAHPGAVDQRCLSAIRAVVCFHWRSPGRVHVAWAPGKKDSFQEKLPSVKGNHASLKIMLPGGLHR
jgi:hypothetical protein